MSHIIHRNLHRPPPLAVHAAGLTVTDSAGREYLDASCGAAVSSLGHAHPDVLAAMQRESAVVLGELAAQSEQRQQKQAGNADPQTRGGQCAKRLAAGAHEQKRGAPDRG